MMLSLLPIWNFRAFQWLDADIWTKCITNAPQNGVFPPFVTPKIFLQKSGSVTFVPLWCSNFIQTKTSIQWTPGLKFISAKTKKILVKNDFWLKMNFEQQNKKKSRKKTLFFRNKLEKAKFAKRIFWKSFFQLQVTIPSAHPVQISSRSDYCITLS